MACGNDADCVRDFSAADGFRRDAHAEIRREAQRQTRPSETPQVEAAGASMPALVPTLVAWTAVLA